MGRVVDVYVRADAIASSSSESILRFARRFASVVIVRIDGLGPDVDDSDDDSACDSSFCDARNEQEAERDRRLAVRIDALQRIVVAVGGPVPSVLDVSYGFAACIFADDALKNLESKPMPCSRTRLRSRRRILIQGFFGTTRQSVGKRPGRKNGEDRTKQDPHIGFAHLRPFVSGQGDRG